MSRPTQVPPGLCEPISPTGLSPAAARFSKTLRLSIHTDTVDGPTTPADALPQRRFGLLRVRSPLLAQSLLLSFPPGTEMFQFPGFASCLAGCRPKPAGCPIRKSALMSGICPLARLIAACHVLRRLREPRHPSCALVSFLSVFRL